MDTGNAKYANGKVEEYQRKLQDHLEKYPQLRRKLEREKIPVKSLSISTEHSTINYEKEIFKSTDKLPKEYKPNTIVDKLNSKGEICSRTFYGSNARMKQQISTTNHGNPKTHPFPGKGEHMHDIIWDNDKIAGRPERELTEAEREENKDIL